jgi:hypothetical protein
VTSLQPKPHADADARLVAAALIDGGEQAGGVAELAQKLGWAARRMNPALAVLISRGLVMESQEIDPVWATVWIRRQPGLRDFTQQWVTVLTRPRTQDRHGHRKLWLTPQLTNAPRPVALAVTEKRLASRSRRTRDDHQV